MFIRITALRENTSPMFSLCPVLRRSTSLSLPNMASIRIMMLMEWVDALVLVVRFSKVSFNKEIRPGGEEKF